MYFYQYIYAFIPSLKGLNKLVYTLFLTPMSEVILDSKGKSYPPFLIGQTLGGVVMSLKSKSISCPSCMNHLNSVHVNSVDEDSGY